jgi:hypothetical protein
MTGLYSLLTQIKDLLEADVNVNSVSFGNVFELDLNKQSIYPISHFSVGTAQSIGYANRFSITVISMDIVDVSKSEGQLTFEGNNNEIDVLNTQFHVQARLVELLQRSPLLVKLVIADEVNYESFTDRFQDAVAGWTLTFDVDIPKDMTIQ